VTSSWSLILQQQHTNHVIRYYISVDLNHKDQNEYSRKTWILSHLLLLVDKGCPFQSVDGSVSVDRWLATERVKAMPQCWMSFKYSHTHHSHYWTAEETAVIPIQLGQYSSPAVHLSCPSWCDTCPGGEISLWSHHMSCKNHLIQSPLALWCAIHTKWLLLHCVLGCHPCVNKKFWEKHDTVIFH